jgi:hypothetical protein
VGELVLARRASFSWLGVAGEVVKDLDDHRWVGDE